MAVETRYQQSITSKSTNVRRVRTKMDTNQVPLVDVDPLTNAPPQGPPPPGPPPSTNGPAQTVTTSTTSTEQDTSIKLLDVEPLDK